MTDTLHLDRGGTWPERPDDSFGLWLDGQAPPPASEKPSSEALRALRAFRAGRGPLSSVVTGSAVLGGPEPRTLAAAGKVHGDFRPLDAVAAVAVAVMIALATVAAYALRNDLDRLGLLARLSEQNEEIREYNRARNVIVRHLARRRHGRLAELARRAEAERHSASDRGVLVFTPGGKTPGRRNYVRVSTSNALRELDDRFALEIAAAEDWSPPPVVAGYDQASFGFRDLLMGRGLVVVVLAAAVLCLALWSCMAYANLPALDAPPTSFTPATAGIWWLVPVANLFVPCAMLREVWLGSDPRTLGKSVRFRLPVVGLWWLCLLGAIALTAFAASRWLHAIGVDTMQQAVRWALYADAAVLVTAGLTLGLIATASWNQARRHRRVARIHACLGGLEAD